MKRVEAIHLTREKLGDGPDPVLKEIRDAYPELGFLFDEVDDARYSESHDVRGLELDIADLEDENARLRANIREAEQRFRQISKITTEHVVRTLADAAEDYMADARVA